MDTWVLIEAFGLISGLLYLFLEIKQLKLMWLVGIITAIIYALIFFSSSLYAQVLLQIYYFVVSIYGWREWNKSKESPNEIVYRVPSVKNWIIGIFLVIILFLFLTYILKLFTPDPLPAADAATTAISILAMYWLSKSFIHQWFLWVIVNVLTIIICVSQHLYLTSILYLLDRKSVV